MGQIGQVIKKAFNLHGDTASYDEIHDRIMSGGEVKGTNLCVLVLAIFIASIGLNMNSTAVIIGAMLVSPLMGGIMAIGYGLVTGDYIQARNSAIGLVAQILICLVTSTIYFCISPITTASSELLARTNPTIWDVLIASCGGFAGVIGMTRKEKSNVIPGVAIATALMPPLCTAGYGIAVHSIKYFGGAMYLFFINTYFICLATCIGLVIMKIPQKRKLSPEVMRKLSHRLVRTTIIVMIPSIIFGLNFVRQEMHNSTAVTSNESLNLNVHRMVLQIQLLYPEVEDIEIGYVDTWDEKAEQNTEKLCAYIYYNGELDEEAKSRITKWMDYEVKADKKVFILK